MTSATGAAVPPTLIRLIAAAAVGVAMVANAFATLPSASIRTNAMPRTPWGDPDLQGTWSGDSAFSIPLERPEALGTKAEWTDDELAPRIVRDDLSRQRAAEADGIVEGLRTDAAWHDRTFRQTSLIVEPPDGRMPALTPEAAARQAATPRGSYGDGPLDSHEDFTLFDRCISLGVVGSMLPRAYGNGYTVIQAPGYVALVTETIHEARIIPLDGRRHVSPRIRSFLGDSRGHWEHDTLVVETTNLNGRTDYSSAAMTIIERLTRVAPDLLRYEAAIDDPSTYKARLALSIPFTAPNGYSVFPYECHEGNRAVLNGLAAERAEDAAIANDTLRGISRPRTPVQNGLTAGGQPVIRLR